MTYEDLLEFTLDSAKYYTRSNDVSVVYGHLHGHTVEDIAMDVIEKILLSKTPLDDLTKTYIGLTTKSVCIDLLRKQDSLRDLGDLKEAEELYEPLESTGTIESSMIQSFTREEKMLYELSIEGGCPDDAVGYFLAVSARTVRRRLGPLKLKIMEYLGTEGTEGTEEF